MELRQYMRTLGKWWWLIALCTICAGAASFTISNLLPPIYEASLMLISNQSGNTGIVDYSSVLSGQQMIETYRTLLQAQPVLETVISRLDLPYSVRTLTKRVKVEIVPNTQLLRLRVEDNDPVRAAEIANELAITFLLQRSAEQQLEEIEDYERALAQQMNALEQDIDKTATEIVQLQASPNILTQDQVTRLQTYQSQQRATYASLLAAYLNVRSLKSRLVDLVVVNPAQVPTEPIRPRKVLNTAVSLTGGCVIACFMAFLLEYLNDYLENEEELRRVLSIPSLGTVPLVRSWRRTGHADLDGGDWRSAEAFRVLRTNIQFADIDRHLHTLLVTSAVPREGKTSIISNLGAAMARNGKKVLLVDADLRKAQLHQVFGMSDRRGLTSLLLDDTDQQDCILPTDISDLYVLPSGPLPPNPSELLGSKRMGDVIQDLREYADVVLFDVPPVLACADTMVLASQIDGVVLVVDSRSTRREAAVQALESLQNVEARVLGAVLNKGRARSGGYYYYSNQTQKPFWKRWFSPRKRRRRSSKGKTVAAGSADPARKTG